MLKNSLHKIDTRYITVAAVIAALYVGLTFAVYPVAFGPVQFRLSECLAVLPLLMPEAVPGLVIGCLLANIAGGGWDMLIGTTATLIAVVLTRYSRKIYFGVIPPIVVNALMVPLIFLAGGSDEAYIVNVITVGIGQAAVILAVGIPFYYFVKRADKRFDLRRLGKNRPKAPLHTDEDDDSISF